MASIRENRSGDKVISYRFSIYLEGTSDGKMIKKTTTWKPLSNLSPAKARKAAEVKARQWEREVKAAYQEEKEIAAAALSPPISSAPALRSDDFNIYLMVADITQCTIRLTAALRAHTIATETLRTLCTRNSR